MLKLRNQNKKIIVPILFCLMVFNMFLGYASILEVEGKSLSYSADDSKLKIINSLVGKDITCGEFIELVFPEMLNKYSEIDKEFLFQEKMSWQSSEKDRVELKESSKITEEIQNRSLPPIISVWNVPNIGFSSYLSYDTSSSVIEPLYYPIPQISIITLLYDESGIVVSSSASIEYNSWYCKAGGIYTNVNSGERYRVTGSHYVTYPVGYTPSQAVYNTSTSWYQIP